MIKRITNKLFFLLKSYKTRGIRLFRPSNCHISKSAVIKIEKKFYFNMPWEMRSKCSLGSLNISDKATCLMGDIRFYAGSSLSVDGFFSMKSGYVNNSTKIFCRNKIEIGEDVIIAPEVIIRDSDQHQIMSLSGGGGTISAPIKIGNHVWVGTRAVILKGVTIGNNCVIAAGSVVTHNVPDNCLVAGVPAKIIKNNVTWK